MFFFQSLRAVLSSISSLDLHRATRVLLKSAADWVRRADCLYVLSFI